MIGQINQLAARLFLNFYYITFFFQERRHNLVIANCERTTSANCPKIGHPHHIHEFCGYPYYDNGTQIPMVRDRKRIHQCFNRQLRMRCMFLLHVLNMCSLCAKKSRLRSTRKAGLKLPWESSKKWIASWKSRCGYTQLQPVRFAVFLPFERLLTFFRS